jgi:hypothetical protein
VVNKDGDMALIFEFTNKAREVMTWVRWWVDLRAGRLGVGSWRRAWRGLGGLAK